MFAQFAANDVAAAGCSELFTRYGAATATACFERFPPSPRPRRAALPRAADGVWEGKDGWTTMGWRTIASRIHVRSTSRGDEALRLQRDRRAGARAHQHHVPSIACSSVYYAMKALVAPDVPPNEGCYRPLHVIVPQGSVLRADADRPVVGGNHETSQRVVDAIMKALAPVLPHRVSAGGPTTSGLLIFGARYADGRWQCYMFTAAARGHRDKDGASACAAMSAMNRPV